ncbi:MAG: ABC transporter permease [Bacillus sp. (in: firmicutes)]
MNLMKQILKEQALNLHLILRLSVYEVKSTYSMHYLGMFWQVLNPFIQICIYWFVFGFGIRGGAPVEGVPFFLWLIAGLVPWLYISPTVTQGANSIYSKVALVSKMNFPVSVLPSVKIVGNGFSFVAMLVIAWLIIISNGLFSGVYLLQLPYYLLCLCVLLFSVTLLLSTLTTIIRDIQSMVQSFMRIQLYLLPILWNVNSLPPVLLACLKLNPFFYIIEGFRNALLGEAWFFEDPWYTSYFWLMTAIILLIGSSVHLKFRHKFVDYM